MLRLSGEMDMKVLVSLVIGITLMRKHGIMEMAVTAVCVYLALGLLES